MAALKALTPIQRAPRRILFEHPKRHRLLALRKSPRLRLNQILRLARANQWMPGRELDLQGGVGRGVWNGVGRRGESAAFHRRGGEKQLNLMVRKQP